MLFDTKEDALINSTSGTKKKTLNKRTSDCYKHSIKLKGGAFVHNLGPAAMTSSDTSFSNTVNALLNMVANFLTSFWNAT